MQRHIICVYCVLKFVASSRKKSTALASFPRFRLSCSRNLEMTVLAITQLIAIGTFNTDIHQSAQPNGRNGDCIG